jgi:Domain of unknown function (DUF4815)
MSGLKTFPQKPYFDDYNASNDYLRVLFRPGYAVQTREVNQLQTILQTQISRFGDHFFENGARVVRGEASYNKSFAFIKVNTPLARGASSYENVIIAKNGSSIKAKSIFCVKATGGDPDTLYVQYTSGSGSYTNTVLGGDIITITHADASTETATVSGVGVGSIISLDDGVYYISGQFVIVPKSFLIISKYTSDVTSDVSVGFVVDHKIITDGDDSSLLDNANGTTNYSAPGAHRYKIVPTLVNRASITSAQLESYIEIVRVVEGAIATKAHVTDYTVFQDILAKRTFDESGDYVSDEFLLDVKEHLQTSTNRGHFTLASGGDSSKLVYALDPGKAYVRGYPIETAYNTFLATDKARTTTSHDNVFTTLSYASSIRVSTTGDFVFGLKVDLRDATNSIGSASIRDIRIVSANVIDIDLVNISMNSGKGLSDVANVLQGSSAGAVTSYNYDATNSALVYELPFGYIQNLVSASVYYRRQFTVTATAASVTVAASDAFSGSPSDYVCQYQHSGGYAIVAPSSVVVASGGLSATLSLPHTPTSIVRVTAGLIRASLGFRSKTISSITETTSAATPILTKTDGVRLVSVSAGGNDVTAFYNFDGGQRDTVYDFARLVAKSGAPSSGSVTVTYEYFAHSPGDYFCKNSYSGIDYGSIPSYQYTNGKQVFLGSVVDFRRSVTSVGIDYADGFASQAKVNSEIITDYTTYLGRYDKIIVDKFGLFSVKQGIPSSNPTPPSDVDNALTLYTILVKPYTFSNTDVSVKSTNNRRYTMRDIGSLDKRLESVEYYTALNLLEKQTLDQTFVNKFNTGFLVDNFTSQAVADTSSNELSIGYDLVAGEIRPQTPSKFIPLGYQSGIGVVNVDGQVMLDYDTVDYISQPLASEIQRIQPYVQYSWNGAITLAPSQDAWHDTEYLPDVVVDGGVFSVLTNTNGFDTTVNFAYGNLDSQTGVTTTTSANGLVTTTDRFVGNVPSPFIRSRIITINGVGLKPNTKLHVYFDETNVDAFVRPVGGTFGSEIVTDGAGAFSCEYQIPSSASIRFRAGTRIIKITDAFSGIIPATSASALYESNGTISQRSKTITTTRSPNKTSRNDTIGIGVIGLVGDAFGGSAFPGSTPSAVTQDSLSAALAAIAAMADNDVNESIANVAVANAALDAAVIGGNAAAIAAANAALAEANTALDASTAALNAANDAVASVAQGQATLDAALDASIAAQVDADAAVSAAAEGAAAAAAAAAEGAAVGGNDSTGGTAASTGDAADGDDPLAQSFIIPSVIGAFITGIDVYFGPDAATNTSSATVELRNVVNGYPGTQVIARKLLPASSLIPSSNGSLPTTFTFSHPVFLEGNLEYCFVVKSDSETLTIWTCTLGAKSYKSTDTTVATGEVITKQTFLGSLFRSQNDRTWTAEQTSDIKFTMKRASFKTTTGSVVLSNKVPSSDVTSPYSQSLYNVMTFTNGSNIIKITHPNHGFVTGNATIVSANGTPPTSIVGIPASEIFTSKIVTVIDSDTYTIQTTTNAGASLVGGGSITIASKAVFAESSLRVSDITPSGSKIDYQISSKIRGGVQDAYIPTVKRSPKKYSSLRISDASNDQSLLVSASFAATAGGFISPVIDLYDAGVVAITNRVNATGIPKAVYVQKAITLKNAADEFATYIDVNRPSGSSIDVYYRVAQDNVATSAWVQAIPQGAQSFSTDADSFNEYKFTNASGIGDFFVIQIKVVLWSSNEALVPRCKNLRTITLKGA